LEPWFVGSNDGAGTSATSTSGGVLGVGSGCTVSADPPPLVTVVSTSSLRSRPPDGRPSTAGPETSIRTAPASGPVGAGDTTTGGRAVSVKTGRGGRGRLAGAI